MESPLIPKPSTFCSSRTEPCVHYWKAHVFSYFCASLVPFSLPKCQVSSSRLWHRSFKVKVNGHRLCETPWLIKASILLPVLFFDYEFCTFALNSNHASSGIPGNTELLEQGPGPFAVQLTRTQVMNKVSERPILSCFTSVFHVSRLLIESWLSFPETRFSLQCTDYGFENLVWFAYVWKRWRHCRL